jgi:hypothetical protein
MWSKYFCIKIMREYTAQFATLYRKHFIVEQWKLLQICDSVIPIHANRDNLFTEATVA